jgi:hypothetical protein
MPGFINLAVTHTMGRQHLRQANGLGIDRERKSSKQGTPFSLSEIRARCKSSGVPERLTEPASKICQCQSSGHNYEPLLLEEAESEQGLGKAGIYIHTRTLVEQANSKQESENVGSNSQWGRHEGGHETHDDESGKELLVQDSRLQAHVEHNQLHKSLVQSRQRQIREEALVTLTWIRRATCSRKRERSGAKVTR